MIDYKDIDSFIGQNREALVRDIGRLVAVPSVEGPAEPDAPFGKEPKRALELGLQIAAELGLETRNFENRIGCGEVRGESDKYLATITHVDVVPAGEGWTADPFTMREREGWILGRGVLDDKGPSIVCLYALKYLRERNVPLRYGVRALLGSNEETHMKDVEYYLENYPAPAFCFSPDADFPVCNGEKGIYQAELVSKCPLSTIVSVNGGFAVNAIPDKATAVLKCGGKLPASTESVTVTAENGAAEVVVKDDVVPFYIDPNSPAIQTCLSTYNEVTGESAKTFTMGGGTYARHFPNAASFGPEHPERPMPAFAGSIHGVDEAACVEWLLEALKVYIAALIKLQDVEF